MSEFMIQHWPVDSKAEAEKLGRDLLSVATCSPPKSFENRGCNEWGSCIFTDKRFGEFKGTHPHNVGYYLRTAENKRKEDYCPCYVFMRSLYDRMLAGMHPDPKQNTGELIAIVAQEGETITVKEVIMEPVPGGLPGSARIVIRPKQIPVPKHPRLKDIDIDSAYESTLVRNRVDSDWVDRMQREGLAERKTLFTREEIVEVPGIDPTAGPELAEAPATAAAGGEAPELTAPPAGPPAPPAPPNESAPGLKEAAAAGRAARQGNKP